MPRILYNPETAALITWPRQDDEDVVGLQPPVVMLTIEQAEPPTDYDPAAYGLAPTQDVDLDALVLRRGWELVELPPPPPVVPAPRWVQFAQALAGSDEIKALADRLLNQPSLIEVARRNATAETIGSAFSSAGGSKPGTLARGISRLISFSMSRRKISSSRHTRLRASPCAPARPVRPMRCT